MPKPAMPPASLIERASELYGFDAFAVPAPVVPVAAVTAPFQPDPVVRAVPAGDVQTIDLAMLRDCGFIQPGSAPTTLSEEFRLAKRHVLMAALGGRSSAAVERGRAVLICSAQPNEGKTFCSVNLALSMASETDIEILLVDADVAKPEILSTLGLPGGPGLMDAIADPSLDVEEMIIRTSIPSLSVLPAGKQSHTDTELLASARTQQVIDALIAANPRRIVIIDTAPVLAASPASVLAHHVGQIVMIVRADRTNESELREALSLFDGDARIQLLLNGASFAGTNQNYGSYYGYGG